MVGLRRGVFSKHMCFFFFAPRMLYESVGEKERGDCPGKGGPKEEGFEPPIHFKMRVEL